VKTNMQGWKKLTTGNVTVNFIEGGHWDAITDRNYPGYKTIIENVLTR
jgi:surfactin synthase thioesterase subunit